MVIARLANLWSLSRLSSFLRHRQHLNLHPLLRERRLDFLNLPHSIGLPSEEGLKGFALFVRVQNSSLTLVQLHVLVELAFIEHTDLVGSYLPHLARLQPIWHLPIGLRTVETS